MFLAFWITTLILYWPTHQAGFVTDVTGGIERLTNQPFWKIGTCFGFPALNQLSVFAFYSCYQLFGTVGLPWYLIFCGLHAANAILLWDFSHRLFQCYVQNAKVITFLGALLFLVHPYQSEVLVWRACFNYLLVTFFALQHWRRLWKFLDETEGDTHLKNPGWWQLHLYFLLALFTFELALVIPLIDLIIYLLFQQKEHPKRKFCNYFQQISIPQSIALAGYFLLHRLLFGTWIGHYGAATHLQFSPTYLLDNLAKYIIKYGLLVRSYGHYEKVFIFEMCEHYGWQVLLGITVLLGFIGLVFKKKISRKHFLIIGLTGCTVLALLPVLNLYFYYLQAIENDRYGYFASVFGLPLIVLLIYQLPKILRYLLLITYFSASCFLLVRTNQIWQQSTEVFYHLLEDYRWHNEENVVILNIPDNYQGAYLFRIIGRGSGFQDALTTIGQKPVKGKIWEVAQYNMTQLTDGVKVNVLDKNRVKVSFNQWGNWWWRNGVGVGPTHKRSIYTVYFKGPFYELELINPPNDAVFIYQDGLRWKKVVRGSSGSWQ
ncbi:MAG: hypothetical protein AAF960_03325 [Bacteroidota bacterium]